MAIQYHPIVHFLPPTGEQVSALQTVSAYLNQAGTQAASFLLGFPPLNDDTTMLVEFSTCLLRSAALCEGLVDLADEQQRS